MTHKWKSSLWIINSVFNTGSHGFYLRSFGQQKSHIWIVVLSGLVQSRLTRLQKYKDMRTNSNTSHDPTLLSSFVFHRLFSRSVSQSHRHDTQDIETQSRSPKTNGPPEVENMGTEGLGSVFGFGNGKAVCCFMHKQFIWALIRYKEAAGTHGVADATVCPRL